MIPKPLPERGEFLRGESPLLQYARRSDQLVYLIQGLDSPAAKPSVGSVARRLGVLFGGIALLVAVVVPIGHLTAASAIGRPGGSATARIARQLGVYNVGTPDPAEPSGQEAPTTSAISGYQLSSVTNFSGSAIPVGWTTFSGASDGDPGSSWATNHVLVGGNMLHLTTSQTPGTGAWVSGGICQCSRKFTYGAVFIRSRITGPGPTQVEMLWPAAGGWPPEMDFVETYGGTTSAQATLHYSKANLQIHKNIDINMTAWHTWGVVWSPTVIDYTVDGKVWATITEPSAIPDQPMALHIQQQTWCSSDMACPKSPQATEVNWVAEYTSTAQSRLRSDRSEALLR